VFRHLPWLNHSSLGVSCYGRRWISFRARIFRAPTSVGTSFESAYGSYGYIEACTASRNTQSGVQVNGSSSAYFQNNEVFSNTSTGVSILSHSYGESGIHPLGDD
jgi:parallel beta-helix repeat protein